MISHSDIENIIGARSLVSDQMQRAIEDWYAAAIEGEPLDHNPDTLSLDLPAVICSELSRLTTLELEAKVEGSARANWINAQLQQVLSPRRRRILSVAMALGSGIWKPYQSGDKLGVSFIPATGYYPVAHDIDGNLTEAVFIDTIQDNNNYYHRMEWMHVLEREEDLRDAELQLLEDLRVEKPTHFPCLQVINLAFLSAFKDSLGTPVELGIRPEWDEIAPVAWLPRLKKLPVGYFVTPIINPIEPTGDLGAAMFEPARRQIIDADEQYTRLDWEYEAGEIAVDTDASYLQPTDAGQQMSKAEALRKYGVPPEALTTTTPHHRERVFHGLDLNTGITQQTPFYQVFAPSLRDTNYLSGLNQYLRNVESHAGLSFGILSQVSDVEKTATEIMSSRQKLYATVSDCQAAMEEALRGLIDALNYWADHVPGAPQKGALEVSFQWDDSIIIDRLTERTQWQQEVTMGLRSKAEYRMHFYGEDEATARRAIQAVHSESAGMDVLEGVLNGSSSNRKAKKQ